MTMIEEHKYTVTIDNLTFTGFLKVPEQPMSVFNRNVLAYIELENIQNVTSGTKKLTIVWPKNVYPYVINPSNVVFEIDDELIFQHGIKADPYSYTTEHVISLPESFMRLRVYIFEDRLCNSTKTIIGQISDVKECNSFNMYFARSHNEYVTTECNSFSMYFQRSFNEYVTTGCNTFNMYFARSLNEYVTTECNAFNMYFARSFDFSISLE